MDQILGKAIISNGMEVHSDGKTIAVIDFDHIHAAYPYSVSLVQSETEAVLAGRLAELDVTVERSSTLASYVSVQDHVDAEITRRHGHCDHHPSSVPRRC